MKSVAELRKLDARWKSIVEGIESLEPAEEKFQSEAQTLIEELAGFDPARLVFLHNFDDLDEAPKAKFKRLRWLRDRIELLPAVERQLEKELATVSRKIEEVADAVLQEIRILTGPHVKKARAQLEEELGKLINEPNALRDAVQSRLSETPAYRASHLANFARLQPGQLDALFNAATLLAEAAKDNNAQEVQS